MSKSKNNVVKFKTFKNGPTIDDIDVMATSNLEFYPMTLLDDDRFEFNAVSGEANERYNSDAKYMLGGIIAQYGWSLQRKHEVLKEREAARAQELEINGAESSELPRMDLTITKIQEGIMFWEFQMMVQVEMFERIARMSWGEGKAFTADDKYGQAWWASYKERMSGRRVLAPTSSEESKQRLLKKRTG